MTDFELRYSEKSVKEYIRQSFLGNSVVSMLPAVLCAAMLTAVPIVSLTGYFMLKQNLLLIVAICAVVIDITILIILSMLIKKYTRKLCTALRAFDGLVCAVSDNDLILVRDNAPQKIIGWENITEISEGKTAYFLRTENGFIIILEKEHVLSGTLEEAAKIIENKMKKK